MSAATPIARSRRPAASCPPLGPTRAVKLALRPMPEAIARVPAALPQAEPAVRVTSHANRTPQHTPGYHDLTTKEDGS
jgi:hypothetical protein